MAFDPITAIAETGKSLINKFFRDKASEAEIEQIGNNFELETRRLANDQTSNFYKFVLDYAGSARDYKDMKFVGPLMLLIRGMVRPGITYATAYWDWLFFTAPVDWDPLKISLLAKINIIVLIFWFGDRIINSSGVANLIEKFFATKQ